MTPGSPEYLLNEIRAAYKRVGATGNSVLLAVSGGSDSLALMHLSRSMADECDLDLHVGFVDHGLRPGVDQELRLVRKQTEALGLTLHALAVPAENRSADLTGDSLQQWARDQRYRLLSELAARIGATHVATGHTLDDQAETFLLRLLRGTGLDGLRCMRETRPLEDLTLIRPLLGLRRTLLREYLASVGSPWADDPSNEDPRFARVCVRGQLLPSMEQLQPGVAGRLALLAGEIDSVLPIVDSVVSVDSHFVPLRLAGGIKVSKEVFEKLRQALWPRLVREALERVRGDLRRIERIHVDQIVEQLAAGIVSGGVPLPGTAVAYPCRGDLYLFGRELDPGAFDETPAVSNENSFVQARWPALGVEVRVEVDKSMGDGDLNFRLWRAGDRLFGSGSSMKKSFQRQGVPRIYRPLCPVVQYEGGIVAAWNLVQSRSPRLRVDWRLDADSPLRDLL